MTTTRKVYLAGAIFGLPDKGQTWREEAIRKMPHGWEALNPPSIDWSMNSINPKNLVQDDCALILSSSAIIARVRNPSWGTAMELFIANQFKIPVIGFPFLRPRVPASYSAWLLAHVTTYCSSLDHAIAELMNVPA